MRMERMPMESLLHELLIWGIDLGVDTRFGSGLRKYVDEWRNAWLSTHQVHKKYDLEIDK